MTTLVKVPLDAELAESLQEMAQTQGQSRDVLKKLSLFLDGPERQTTILHETVVQQLRKRKKS